VITLSDDWAEARNHCYQPMRSTVVYEPEVHTLSLDYLIALTVVDPQKPALKMEFGR